ncbi:CRISPR-associated protein Cas5 [Candidatus Caldatribacterium saccharofermentans]|uniref:CRISPR-associated protein Cas5 n=1 Tax=Candidatus Caldatribacterium saccharofermentans TaxID=1454753 RepID=UPI003D066D7F
MIAVLEAIRVVITAHTASFRVPHFLGYQLTLTVPPLSTVYGLIAAAAGRRVPPDEVAWLAYRCEYEGKATDVETIFTVERSRPSEVARFVTINIVPREFLFMPTLTLYLPPEWGILFRCPRYSLLLGRTQDVATVAELKQTYLRPLSDGEVSGVLLPFELVAKGNIPALLQTLPVAFTDDPIRQPIEMRTFGVVDMHCPGNVRDGDGWLLEDTENGIVVPIFRRAWVLRGVA